MSDCLTLQALEEIVRANPHVSDPPLHPHLRSCQACTQQFHKVRANLILFDECVGLPPTSCDLPKIPGYEILEEIHRGAQGVVYKAFQRNTNRTVALKVLLHGPYASRRQKYRFEREIDLVASLDHPNIVTLYDSGQADGRYYFAMRYVDGLPLRDHIAANRSSVSDTLGLFSKICRAVAFAHQNGIIHRDLKPGNILVDKTAQPHILDFGMAKPTDSMGGVESLATQTGEFFGTLAYASPEQVSGKHNAVNTRSDVYALGVILYELLTGLLPYNTENSITETLFNITEVDPLRPSRHNRLINDELDRIILKSLSKEPDRRYHSADALAADIDRYLTGRPIEAKSDSQWYLLRKNLVRHRKTITSVAVVFVIILASAVISARQWQIARRNAKIAERNFTQARSAVDSMLTEVGNESLENIPQMMPVRQALLEKALSFYQNQLDQGTADPSIHVETAKAYRRVGENQFRLGQLQASTDTLHRSVELLEELVRRYPDEPMYRSELAGSYTELSITYFFDGKREKSHEYSKKMIKLIQDLATEFPNMPAYQRALGDVHTTQAGMFRDTGNRKAAENEYRQALEIHEQLEKQGDEDPKNRAALAFDHHWLGDILKKTGRFAEARDHFQRCVAIRSELLAEFPDNRIYRTDLHHVRNYLGHALLKLRDLNEAHTVLTQAVADGEALIADYPNVPRYREHLAASYQNLGEVLIALEQHEKATEAFRHHVSQYAYISERFPENSSYRLRYAWAEFNLGSSLFEAKLHTEAANHFSQAMDAFESLMADYPDKTSFAEKFAWAVITCPDPQFHDGQRAIDLIKKNLNDGSNSPRLWQILGIAYYRIGQWQETLRASDQAPEDATKWFFQAMAHWQLGNTEQARQLFDKATHWADTNSPENLDIKRFQAEAAQLLSILDPPFSTQDSKTTQIERTQP